MSRSSLPARRGPLRRGAAGLILALAIPLTMGASCGGGENEENQQEQQDGEEQDDGYGEQEDD